MNSNSKVLGESLIHLLQKYGVETPSESYSIQLSTANRSAYGWELSGSSTTEHPVPLFPWRSKRSFIELHNLVQNNIVQKPSLLRFCFFTDNSWAIEAQLYREFDIVEFVTGQKIIALHAVIDVTKGGNVIATLEKGILCSIELSNVLPIGTPYIDRHEIICERGVASDMVVDTQIAQKSVYLFTEQGQSTFTDYDAELYGFTTDEVDVIRSAFTVFKEKVSKDDNVQQDTHLKQLINCALKSGVEKRKINTR